MSRVAIAFTVTSFAPVPLLIAGAFFGAVWAWAALLYITLFAFAMDELVGAVADDGREFPAADKLAISLAIAHFVVLGTTIWAMGRDISFGHAAALFAATGLFFGKISNANAHELIHRGQRGLHQLGKWVYISLLFGHHCSAHRLVHHRYVGTHDDPNTARAGESFFTFVLRAWQGSYLAGLEAENHRRQAGASLLSHPYVTYSIGAVIFVALSFLIGGWVGCAIFILLCLFAQVLLLMSDYVQHYGLTRHDDTDGESAGHTAVQMDHSWNAPHVFTGYMMLNAARHSAHHTHPSLHFTELSLPEANEAPTLPYSLPAMSVIALFPPWWRNVMDPRLAFWQARPLDLS